TLRIHRCFSLHQAAVQSPFQSSGRLCCRSKSRQLLPGEINGTWKTPAVLWKRAVCADI
ncbi:mCG141830, isoform CRA_b, partial [Mus musculus]